MLNNLYPISILNQPESNSSSRTSSAGSDSSFLSHFYQNSGDSADEIDNYLATQWIANENMDVFSWWVERKDIYPRLSELAIKVHSIPASSLQSERTFNRGGQILNSRRTGLKGGTVESLSMLNKNYEFEVRARIQDNSLNN